MFFEELINQNRFSFYEELPNWQIAIEKSCIPLVDDGSIDQIYVGEIIKKIKEYGPYIVIAPDICIPHAQESVGVHKTSICFMNTQKPVSFSDDPGQDARIFFVLASENNEKHLQNLVELSDLLSDDAIINDLKKATSKKHLLEILHKIS